MTWAELEHEMTQAQFEDETDVVTPTLRLRMLELTASHEVPPSAFDGEPSERECFIWEDSARELPQIRRRNTRVKPGQPMASPAGSCCSHVSELLRPPSS